MMTQFSLFICLLFLVPLIAKVECKRVSVCFYLLIVLGYKHYSMSHEMDRELFQVIHPLDLRRSTDKKIDDFVFLITN
ncbi:hypothetical protein O6H91_Y104400 [Diphasiastrum complanatum]|nr:hypothetical protein O6H91_Y104400 [Diphasiastrum complanatum]